MESHRIWTATTVCWFFAVFNVERIFPQVNIASFVYFMATVAGVSMLAIPALRRQRFAVTAVGFGLVWITGRCMLGYNVDLATLPLVLTEAFVVAVSQFLCLRIAQNADEFEMKSTQMLEVLTASSAPDLREFEAALLEEIRRARRHERPLTFVSITPGTLSSDALTELVQQLTKSLTAEYMAGCLSRLLSTKAKSHDLTVRVGDQFLMLLPETNAEQAQAMSRRIQFDMLQQLGVSVRTDTYAFGIDEVTLSGVLDRLGIQPLTDAAAKFEVFDLRSSKAKARRRGIIDAAAAELVNT